MPHRNDHEAALLRADAFERELDRERAKASRVERLETEIAAARARLANAEHELAEIRPGAPKLVAETPSATGSAWVLRGVLLFGVLLAWFGSRPSSSEDNPRVREPTAANVQSRTPVLAIDELPRGLALVHPQQRITGIAFDYIGNDGRLDPVHGGIVVETTTLTIEAPDDPSRPTGAPRPSGRLATQCTYPTWRPSDGWTKPWGGCAHLGSIPTTLPACTVGKVLALSGLGPGVLARVKVRTDIVHSAWQWSVDATDEARTVKLSYEISDLDCSMK